MLTKKMKEWLVANCGVKEDASDDEYQMAMGRAMAEGKLDHDTIKQLTIDPADEKADALSKKLDKLGDCLERVVETLTAAPETKEEETPETKEEETPETKEIVKKMPATAMSKMVTRFGGTPDDLGDKTIEVRVKEAAEMYDDTKSTMTFPAHDKKGNSHPMAGRPVRNFSEGTGRVMENASERDKAVAGAYAKLICATAQRRGSRSLAWHALPQHDKELVLHAMNEYKWGGASDGGDFADIVDRKLTDGEKQALIDDALSGGLEAAPIVFDDLVIETPLLYGELFPLVTTIPLDRGRRVEGVSTGTVTGAWGGVDDTAVALFNTNAYVTAFDTTIFRWEGSVRIGLDFLSDSPIDFGAHFTRQYGERLLEDLDDVIAIGNGATQPLGVQNTVGATAVAFGGATTIGAYETMRFTVPKNEHGANVKASAVFCGTETSYQRARAIPVGAADARRLGGMNYDSYSWMERPYKINASLANTQIFYAILARYRMYRRRGLTIRTSTEGDTLVRRNELLMVAMARYGGQMERAAACAITTTAPA